jgi:hypothetical protein
MIRHKTLFYKSEFLKTKLGTRTVQTVLLVYNEKPKSHDTEIMASNMTKERSRKIP